MGKRLVLIGGSAGSGKTTLARTLAGDLGAGWLQLDTVWTALKAAAGRGSAAFDRLDVAGRMARGGDSDDDVLAACRVAAEAVCRVLPEVFAFELETHPVLVADGSWLLPSFVAGLRLPGAEVSCVFLQHHDVDDLAEALVPRLQGRPPQERHRRMNRQMWQYGAWVAAEARAHDLDVLCPLPFATLPERARAVLT